MAKRVIRNSGKYLTYFRARFNYTYKKWRERTET
jgi:hypothetical protein